MFLNFLKGMLMIFLIFFGILMMFFDCLKVF